MIDTKELVEAFKKLGYTQEEMEEIIDAFNAVGNVYPVPLEVLQKAMETYTNE